LRGYVKINKNNNNNDVLLVVVVVVVFVVVVVVFITLKVRVGSVQVAGRSDAILKMWVRNS
jgi:hypothetical protein